MTAQRGAQSAGKRTARQLWLYLVQKNYQVKTLSLSLLAPPSTGRRNRKGKR